VAPLSRSAPDQEARWLHELKSLGCYEQATYLADHSVLDRPFDESSWCQQGLTLREFLPELGPVHNLEASDGGRLEALGITRRAELFARYLRWCASRGGYSCVSLASACVWDGPPGQCLLTPLAQSIFDSAGAWPGRSELAALQPLELAGVSAL
jgi:hypothetical protein